MKNNRTTEEQRKYIKKLLKKIPRYSDRLISRETGVSHVTVAKYRKKLILDK